MTLDRDTVLRITTAPDRHWRGGWRPVRVEPSRLVAVHQDANREQERLQRRIDRRARRG